MVRALCSSVSRKCNNIVPAAMPAKLPGGSRDRQTSKERRRRMRSRRSRSRSCDCNPESTQGTIHKGSPQNFRVLDPLPPCPHFGLISSTKSTQPPLLCLLLDQPPSPLCADVLYAWSLTLHHMSEDIIHGCLFSQQVKQSQSAIQS